MAPPRVSWKEVSVPLGWGSLRGKTCVLGAPPEVGYQRVVALHGWLDNANSFDSLVPFLPDGLEILALDFAGHGLSDHLPAGCVYSPLRYMIHLRQTLEDLGWRDFVFLTHSMGSFIASYYTAMYPEDVKALIIIDYLLSYLKKERLTTWRDEIDMLLAIERGKGRPRRVYSEEEALSRMVEARKRGDNPDIINVDREAAKILLPRSAQRIQDGYVWRHDEKVRSRFNMIYGHDNWLYVLSHITCPVLLIRADDGILVEPDEVYAPILSAFQKSARIFHYHKVPGFHHVHLTHPHRVAPAVLHFLACVTSSGQGKVASKL